MMTHRDSLFRGSLSPKFAVVALALAAAGCTADIARIEQPGLGLAEGADIPPPRPPQRMRSDLGGSDNVILARAAPIEQGDASPEPPVPSPVSAPRPVESDGKTIEVRKGDTLFGLAKRHGVSVAALRARNNLDGNNLKLGRKLVLPAEAKEGAKPEKSRAETSGRKLPPAPAGWTHTYKMKAGDVLSTVARRHGVKTSELQRVNGITDPRRLRAGAELRVPAPTGGEAPKPLVKTAKADPAPRGEPAARPVILNDANAESASSSAKSDNESPEAAESASSSPGKVATALPEKTPEARQEAVTADKLRWPVKGRIVIGFGRRPDGTQNDGLIIAVPMGTEVHAAGDGSVVYSGDELASYGNLVLVMHENGWVTAYANNSELLVKRGDLVKRGQIIAKAGNSGGAGQPHVHFELRQSSKPVDPTPFMEAM